jgi:uncharacterized protein (DUF433 family)
MTLKELQPQLLALTPEEKAQAIQFLPKSLSNFRQGIQNTPGVTSTEACIRKTRIPVWLLVSYRHQSATDAHILEGHPDLSAVDLVNAFSYAEAYPDEFERAIRE